MSSVYSGIRVHIMLPKPDQWLDVHFMEKSRAFSESVNKRKWKAVKDTVRGQLYDLLKMKSAPKINELRYLPLELFTDIHVCQHLKKRVSVFLNIFLILTNLTFFYIFSLC
jgi:hypothetical protein